MDARRGRAASLKPEHRRDDAGRAGTRTALPLSRQLPAAGLAAYAVGTVLWAFWIERLDAPPFPSPADPLWLLVYPLGFASMVLIVRAQLGRIETNIWLDGLGGALAAAAGR